MLNKKATGFSLMEVMITVVIIAILASIAFPSYQDYIQRSRRAEGKGILLVTQQRVERAYTDLNNFASAVAQIIPASGVNSENGFYLVTSPASAAASYTLQSAPQGPQATDPCGTFQITHTGVRSITGTGTNCW